MLIHKTLEFYARDTQDAPCISIGENTLSYGEMNKLANQLANGFLQLGMKEGERVAILGENSVEHGVTIMAASKAGVVSVPLNYRLAPAELAYIINDSNTKILIVLESMQGMLDALLPQLSNDIVLITSSAPSSLEWSSWLAELPSNSPEIELDENAPVLQLYTSGTTGNPKGVVTSQRNLATLCETGVLGLPNRPDAGSATILVAPMFHIGGAGSLIIALYLGQHTLLHPVFDPVKIVEDLDNFPVANVFMVPAMIMAALQVPGIEQRSFKNLKTITYGASPISESVLRKALDVFKCDFMQSYGMTETTGSVICLSAEDHRRALAGEPELLRSCGRPLMGNEAKVVNSDGEEIPRGEVGEIWIKSPCNMLHYYNLPEATAKDLTDGWVHTGDAGTMDEEGFIYLKDRMKDMVVSGGENIYPVEVENTLAKIEAIVDVAVIGVPNEKFGEALLAFAVLKPGTSLTAEEMVEFCRDKIAGYKIPRQLEIIDELPRNPSGKLLKKVLREPYWKDSDRTIG